MKKHLRAHLHLAVALAAVVPAVSSAQIKVIMSGGFFEAYQQLLPEFEKQTGIAVTTARGPSQGDGPNAIAAQLRRGVPADMVIMNREGLAGLIVEGRVVTGTVVDLAEVPLGMAVRHGIIKPDIATVDALKQALLQARSIGSDSSAIIFVKTELLPRLGVTDSVTAKIVEKGASAVASGDCDLVILPVSELLNAQGIDFVGKIPTELQHSSVFTAAIVTGATESESARKLIAFLRSEAAANAIRNSGMEPSRQR